MTKRTLGNLRSELGEIDREIVRLLNARARISQEIGRLKRERNLSVYDPAREAEIYAQLARLNDGPLPDDSVKSVFREIISVSRSLQKPLEVACLGPEASFTHLAARSHFGTSTRFVPHATIGRVFAAVEKGDVAWGVVPVENSLEGSVNMTLDQLFSTTLKIRAEIFLRISHCLISSAAGLPEIKKVYSHPQALAQCQRWLRDNLPHAALGEVDSTSAAARMVREETTGAAIGSRLAAATYGLQILAEGIEDHPANLTRFFVIGKGEGAATGRDKTSILFGTRNVPGALYQALKPFAERRINMTKIESYPSKEGPWNYCFFVDVEGHGLDETVKICLEELKNNSVLFKMLGSYPRGEEVP
jgi:chorismate mutase/prephenate dehydratase